jgi:hypothetical protein
MGYPLEPKMAAESYANWVMSLSIGVNIAMLLVGRVVREIAFYIN